MINKTSLKTRVARKNLLLPELIIVIFFFSLAAAACVRLFAEARADVGKSRELTEAVIMAQNVAETFKATGEIKRTAVLTNCPSVEEGLLVYADAYERDNITELHIYIRKGREIIYSLTTAVVKEVGVP